MAGESRKSLRGELEVVGEPVVKITGELTLGFATLVAGRSARRVRKTGAVSCPVVSLTLRTVHVRKKNTRRGDSYLAIIMVVKVSGLSVACCSIKA